MSLKFPALCLVSEVALIVLFAVFVRYDEHTDSALWAESTLSNHSNIENEYYFRYPSFQDVHVMIFVGFGFLMTFLKKYGFSSVAFNFLLASLSIQWATLVQGWLANAGHGGDGKIQVGIVSLINADFCTGAVLISFGALLGKTSPVQLLIMTIFEAALFSINEFILLEVLEVKDAGGSMTIHTFGAYFGLTVTRILYRTNLNKSRHREGSVYHSDIFAMIGTVFLWMFWPSFNSAVAETGSPQHRTALNTYYSLAACTLATFAVSSAVNEERKLDMVTSPSRGNGSLGNRSLGNRSLGNHSLDSHSLGDHLLDNHSLGNHSFDNHSLDNRSLGNQSLDNHSLGNRSLGNRSLGNRLCGRRGEGRIW